MPNNLLHKSNVDYNKLLGESISRIMLKDEKGSISPDQNLWFMKADFGSVKKPLQW